jgi:hypothetical protein
MLAIWLPNYLSSLRYRIEFWDSRSFRYFICNGKKRNGIRPVCSVESVPAYLRYLVERRNNGRKSMTPKSDHMSKSSDKVDRWLL